MAQTIKLKRSATANSVPTTAQLELGELAINTNDGRAFLKKDDGSTSTYELVRSTTSDGVITIPNEQVKFTSTGYLQIPVGTTGQRPATIPQGAIRYNSTDSTFEAYDGSNWGSMGGVKDVDQDTFIRAESSPGADEDTLSFFCAGVNVGSMTTATTTLGGTAGSQLTFTNATGALALDGDLTIGDTAGSQIKFDASTGTATFDQTATFSKGITVPTGAGATTFNDDVTIASGKNFTFDGQAFNNAHKFTIKDASGGIVFGGWVLDTDATAGN